MAGRLAGRIAVVTGGSAGIGQEIARKLSSEGADIAVADVDAAHDTQELVEGNGRRFISTKVDVSDAAQVNAFAAEVRDALGPVDILVNNAGIVPFAGIDDVTLEQWNRTFAVNVTGAFLTAKAFLEDLKQSTAGRVINITSGSYWVSPPPFVAYVSSKGALNGFTNVLAANLAEHDVTVNAVSPSLVPTAAALRSADEAFFDMTVQMQDLKRRQSPTDVANTVAFLASDEAAFITGQILAVDGGLTRR
ncbi:SDR family oxidoreductase [Streptomyces sp. NBC_01352]|uniref:SDR family NAD(P)-dependent oxidoreductase n=1 Tax=unclassified Streptomyces TaxID=2593676 RepID=UPI00225292AB|nr:MULTISPECIES: SDR family oxidoreductase [unclassified Streptomyces]MCX4706625.1 SDR family oxidoreductase [Streptomyces sp. NBC_01373]